MSPISSVSRERPVALLLLAAVLVGAAAVLAWRKWDRPTAPPQADATPRAGDSVLGGETIRLLVVGDPFGKVLKDLEGELSRRAGGTVQVELVSYDDVRLLTLANARDDVSAYDIVSFDVVWVGEYGTKKLFLPLDNLISTVPSLETADFLEVAWRCSQFRGQQLGLPVQPHSELLWYRRDWFEEAGISEPVSTDDVLAAARRFHNPAEKKYGILFNGQRGQALGQAMAHFYAAFGQPLLDEKGRPTLNTPKGIAAARYALALSELAPPDVVNMAWDELALRFGQGRVAMTYGWAARAYMIEEEPQSVVAGKAGYAPAPHGPGVPPVTVCGTWSLGIPANIGARRELAWRFLSWLSSTETQRLLSRNGNGGPPRYSLLADPDLRARYPALATMERLGRSKALSHDMRPAIPQWPALAAILGTAYHDMLLKRITPEAAAARAQAEAEALFRGESK